MSSNQSPNFVAGGNINPKRFVTILADNTAIQSVVADFPCGISHEAPLFADQSNAPWGASTPYAGVSPYPVKVYGPGDTCLLDLGGTVAAGNILTPDANGKGIVAAGGGTFVQPGAARALESGTSGQSIRVQVIQSHS